MAGSSHVETPNPRTPTRRIRRLAVIASAIAIVVLALFWLAPRWLERGMIAAFEARGLAPAQLRVESLGLGGLELSGVTLGREPAVQVEGLRVATTPLGLIRGEIESLDIGAAVVRGRLENGRLHLADLVMGGSEQAEPPVAGSDEPEASNAAFDALSAVKRIRIDSLQLALASPRGLFDGNVSLDVATPGGPSIRGDGHGELRLDGEPLATFRLGAEHGAIQLALDAGFDAPALRELGLPEVDGIRLAGRISVPLSESSLAAALAASEMQLGVEGSGRRLATEAGADDEEGETPLELGGRLDVSVEGGRAHVDARLGGRPGFEGPLRVGEGTAQAVELVGDFELQLRDGALVVGAAECLRWKILGASWGASLRAPVPWTGCLHAGEAPLVSARPDGDDWDLNVDLVSDETKVSIESEGRSLVDGELPRMHLQLDAPAGAEPHTSLRIDGGRVRVSDGAATLADALVEWTTGNAASVRLGSLLVGDPPSVRELTLVGKTSVVAPFAWQAELADGPRELRLQGSGRYDPGDGTATAQLQLHPVRFRSAASEKDVGTLQPEDLFPALGDSVGLVDATLSALAELSWKDGELRSGGELHLSGGDFQAETWSIDGLEGSLDFVNLWPTETAEGQRLTFDTLRAGLPLSDGELRVHVGPGWQQLVVESASGHLAGGLLRAEGRLDFEAGLQRLDFQLRDLSLSDMASLADVAELDVTGTLAGRVPVEIADGELTIPEARLVADPPRGRIRYRPETPPAALAGAGAQGELVLRALEDFVYESLEVELGLEPGGEARVLLRLKGANPEVDGGRPIHLSLDLSGPLLEVLRADPLMRDLVERISEGLLEKAPRTATPGE